MSMPFYVFSSKELNKVRELFTQQYEANGTNNIVACAMSVFNIRHDDLSDGANIILVGTRGDRGKGTEEDVLGNVIALAPGIVLFQSVLLLDWPSSGVVFFDHESKVCVFSGHERGGIRLGRLEDISSKPPDIDGTWQAVDIWSGSGHAGFGLTYAIRPELWQRIDSLCQRWLTNNIR